MNIDRLDRDGAVHHVYGRARNRESIFTTRCREDFVSRLSELPQRFDMQVDAWCLMGNHYHLLLASSGRLSESMKWLLGGFVMSHNLRTHKDGPLFRSRFHNRRVDGAPYHAYLFSYLDRNPVEAGLVKHPADWGWSSHRAHAGHDESPDWLSRSSRERLIGPARAYQEFIAAGRAHMPPGFDESLWGSATSLAIPRPDYRARLARLHERIDIDALRGRRVTPGSVATLRYLVENCRLTQEEAGAELGLSANAVCKRLRRRNDKDVQRALDRLHERLAG